MERAYRQKVKTFGIPEVTQALVKKSIGKLRNKIGVPCLVKKCMHASKRHSYSYNYEGEYEFFNKHNICSL